MEKIVYCVEIVTWLNKRETNQLDEKEQSEVVDCKKWPQLLPSSSLHSCNQSVLVILPTPDWYPVVHH